MKITIEECEFSHLGSIGIFLKNTSKFLVQNNVFFDIGYHGILTMYKDEIKDTMEDIMILALTLITEEHHGVIIQMKIFQTVKA